MIRLSIHHDAAAAAHDVAERLRRTVVESPACVLGLPTGRTPIPVYAQLVEWVRAGAVSFEQVTTFNLDEFVGLPGTSDGSFQAFMREHLFGRIDRAPAPRHFLDGLADDLDAEAERYERAIEAAGGLDIVLLGLGTNGHIGFNEPAEGLPARTHVVALTDETRRANVDGFAGDVARVPSRAITMGVGTMLAARRVILMATGTTKAGAVAALVEGPLTTRVPASLLQLHPCVDVVIDAAAAAGLRRA
jgi:glucosamine-6-phosphate deaminase